MAIHFQRLFLLVNGSTKKKTIETIGIFRTLPNPGLNKQLLSNVKNDLFHITPERMDGCNCSGKKITLDDSMDDSSCSSYRSKYS